MLCPSLVSPVDRQRAPGGCPMQRGQTVHARTSMLRIAFCQTQQVIRSPERRLRRPRLSRARASASGSGADGSAENWADTNWLQTSLNVAVQTEDYSLAAKCEPSCVRRGGQLTAPQATSRVPGVFFARLRLLLE